MAYYFASERAGPLSPDVVGRYDETGVHNSNPYYVLDKGTVYYLFFNNIETAWVIASTLDDVAIYYFYRATIEGSYAPNPPATGSINVNQINPEVIRTSAINELSLTGVVSTDFISDQIHLDWLRWCYASINKHFNDMKNGYELYIEGDERTFQDEAEFAELRIDGPFIRSLQKYLYVLDVEINILCQTHVDHKQHYKPQDMIGAFVRAFKNIIPVYKYGNGPFDDGSLLGCLHLSGDFRDKIDINHFGIIRPDTKIVQSTIEGHYRLELWIKETN